MEKLTLLILLFTGFVFSQNNTSNDLVKDRVPTFAKCKGAISMDEQRNCFSHVIVNTISKNLKTNKFKRQYQDIDIFVKIILNKTGKITNIEFLKSNDKLGYFEDEVIRTINTLPKFEPAIKDGKLVSVPYSFPIKLSFE